MKFSILFFIFQSLFLFGLDYTNYGYLMSLILGQFCASGVVCLSVFLDFGHVAMPLHEANAELYIKTFRGKNNIVKTGSEIQPLWDPEWRPWKTTT